MARAGLTPERLTVAGAELADEVGFEHVTVSALARRFDVKVASLYSHLKNSHDLKTRIALYALEELADRVSDAVAGRAGKDALAAFADAYRDYAREHPGRYDAARLRLEPETAAASAGVRHSQMTRAILRGYDLTEPDQTHAVRMLGGVFHGYVSLELAGGFDHSAPDARESWTWIVDSLDALLRNRAAPRTDLFPNRHAPVPDPSAIRCRTRPYSAPPDQQVEAMTTEHDMITTPVTTDMLRGFLEVETTARGLLPHRLPARARRQFPDDQLVVAEAQPSGVRVVFRTRATTVELDTLPTKRVYRGFPAIPDGVYDLLVDGRLTAQTTVIGGNVRTVTDMITQASELREGSPAPPGSPSCRPVTRTSRSGSRTPRSPS